MAGQDTFHYAHEGYCPVCERPARFESAYSWFRDHLLCQTCRTIPRQRALKIALERAYPNWRALAIHESSPSPNGLTHRLQTECAGYVGTQFFREAPLGSMHKGYRCEDLEHQTFADATFDIVITQDVFEHVFDPAQAMKEIYRTLKPGGAHILTTPIYKDRLQTRQCARLAGGKVEHLEAPEYHGNPIDLSGSLVTYKYGYDILELIASWAPFSVEIYRPHDPDQGLVAEFLEVITCWKRPLPARTARA